MVVFQNARSASLVIAMLPVGFSTGAGWQSSSGRTAVAADELPACGIVRALDLGELDGVFDHAAMSLHLIERRRDLHVGRAAFTVGKLAGESADAGKDRALADSIADRLPRRW